jgi:hypothetical protein
VRHFGGITKTYLGMNLAVSLSALPGLSSVFLESSSHESIYIDVLCCTVEDVSQGLLEEMPKGTHRSSSVVAARLFGRITVGRWVYWCVIIL